MNKVAFLTTIFPNNAPYLRDFFLSLTEQSYSNFDIIVLNDDYGSLNNIISEYPSLRIIDLPFSNTIAKNREYGINYCIDNGYDVLIFGDSDDYFSSNRVEKSLELLKKYDIVVNDLSLFDENGVYEEKYISHRLNNMAIVNFEFIRDKNIFGLSNTAVKLSNLNKIDIPSSLIAIDWYLFSILLLDDKKAIFTNETISYYRQHQQNIVGLGGADVYAISKIIDVKKAHFLALYNTIGECKVELDLLASQGNIATIGVNDSKSKKLLWWEFI